MLLFKYSSPVLQIKSTSGTHAERGSEWKPMPRYLLQIHTLFGQNWEATAQLCPRLSTAFFLELVCISIYWGTSDGVPMVASCSVQFAMAKLEVAELQQLSGQPPDVMLIQPRLLAGKVGMPVRHPRHCSCRRLCDDPHEGSMVLWNEVRFCAETKAEDGLVLIRF